MKKFIAHGGKEKVVGNYKIHIFNTSENFVVDSGESRVEVLVVAGGGSGGLGDKDGGSGGGVVQRITPGIIKEGSYLVIVGSGGVYPDDGSDSMVFGIRSIGGKSSEKEMGIAAWSGGSDKSTFFSDISGEVKGYAGSGGNNLPNSDQAIRAGQYANGGGGGHGNHGSGFDGLVIIRYQLET